MGSGGAVGSGGRSSACGAYRGIITASPARRSRRLPTSRLLQSTSSTVAQTSRGSVRGHSDPGPVALAAWWPEDGPPAREWSRHRERIPTLPAAPGAIVAVTNAHCTGRPNRDARVHRLGCHRPAAAALWTVWRQIEVPGIVPEQSQQRRRASARTGTANHTPAEVPHAPTDDFAVAVFARQSKHSAAATEKYGH